MLCSTTCKGAAVLPCKLPWLSCPGPNTGVALQMYMISADLISLGADAISRDAYRLIGTFYFTTPGGYDARQHP